MTEQITGKKLGRKQLIAIISAAIPYGMNYALVWAGKLEGSAFWSGTVPYVTLFLGVVLGGAVLADKFRQPVANG